MHACLAQAKRCSGRTAASPRRPSERPGRARETLPLIPPPPPPRGGPLNVAAGVGGPPDTQATLKLRGLPYSAGIDDITEWLAGATHSQSAMHAPMMHAGTCSKQVVGILP